ncbi:IMPTB protein, partial [Atractosteus spatula]|nr:IMPTB protein [Atractosteus spatula]
MFKPPPTLIVPYGLRSLLASVSRAVVTEQPPQIRSFIASYCSELLSYRNENPSTDIKDLAKQFQELREEEVQVAEEKKTATAPWIAVDVLDEASLQPEASEDIIHIHNEPSCARDGDSPSPLRASSSETSQPVPETPSVSGRVEELVDHQQPLMWSSSAIQSGPGDSPVHASPVEAGESEKALCGKTTSQSSHITCEPNSQKVPSMQDVTQVKPSPPGYEDTQENEPEISYIEGSVCERSSEGDGDLKEVVSAGDILNQEEDGTVSAVGVGQPISYFAKDSASCDAKTPPKQPSKTESLADTSNYSSSTVHAVDSKDVAPSQASVSTPAGEEEIHKPVVVRSAVFQRVPSDKLVSTLDTVLITTASVPSENIIIIHAENLPETIVFQSKAQTSKDNLEHSSSVIHLDQEGQSAIIETTAEAVVYHKVPSVHELLPPSLIVDKIPSAPLEVSPDQKASTADHIPEELASQEDLGSEQGSLTLGSSEGPVPSVLEEVPTTEPKTETPTEPGNECSRADNETPALSSSLSSEIILETTPPSTQEAVEISFAERFRLPSIQLAVAETKALIRLLVAPLQLKKKPVSPAESPSQEGEDESITVSDTVLSDTASAADAEKKCLGDSLHVSPTSVGGVKEDHPVSELGQVLPSPEEGNRAQEAPEASGSEGEGCVAAPALLQVSQEGPTLERGFGEGAQLTEDSDALVLARPEDPVLLRGEDSPAEEPRAADRREPSHSLLECVVQAPDTLQTSAVPSEETQTESYTESGRPDDVCEIQCQTIPEDTENTSVQGTSVPEVPSALELSEEEAPGISLTSSDLQIIEKDSGFPLEAALDSELAEQDTGMCPFPVPLQAEEPSAPEGWVGTGLETPQGSTHKQREEHKPVESPEDSPSPEGVSEPLPPTSPDNTSPFQPGGAPAQDTSADEKFKTVEKKPGSVPVESEEHSVVPQDEEPSIRTSSLEARVGAGPKTHEQERPLETASDHPDVTSVPEAPEEDRLGTAPEKSETSDEPQAVEKEPMAHLDTEREDVEAMLPRSPDVTVLPVQPAHPPVGPPEPQQVSTPVGETECAGSGRVTPPASQEPSTLTQPAHDRQAPAVSEAEHVAGSPDTREKSAMIRRVDQETDEELLQPESASSHIPARTEPAPSECLAETPEDSLTESGRQAGYVAKEEHQAVVEPSPDTKIAEMPPDSVAAEDISKLKFPLFLSAVEGVKAFVKSIKIPLASLNFTTEPSEGAAEEKTEQVSETALPAIPEQSTPSQPDAPSAVPSAQEEKEPASEQQQEAEEGPAAGGGVTADEHVGPGLDSSVHQVWTLYHLAHHAEEGTLSTTVLSQPPFNGSAAIRSFGPGHVLLTQQLLQSTRTGAEQPTSVQQLEPLRPTSQGSYLSHRSGNLHPAHAPLSGPPCPTLGPDQLIIQPASSSSTPSQQITVPNYFLVVSDNGEDQRKRKITSSANVGSRDVKAHLLTGGGISPVPVGSVRSPAAGKRDSSRYLSLSIPLDDLHLPGSRRRSQLLHVTTDEGNLIYSPVHIHVVNLVQPVGTEGAFGAQAQRRPCSAPVKLSLSKAPPCQQTDSGIVATPCCLSKLSLQCQTRHPVGLSQDRGKHGEADLHHGLKRQGKLKLPNAQAKNDKAAQIPTSCVNPAGSLSSRAGGAVPVGRLSETESSKEAAFIISCSENVPAVIAPGTRGRDISLQGIPKGFACPDISAARAEESIAAAVVVGSPGAILTGTEGGLIVGKDLLKTAAVHTVAQAKEDGKKSPDLERLPEEINQAPAPEYPIVLPPEYPTAAPPMYQLNAPWLRGPERMELSNSLEELYAENLGESILYLWVERIREFLVEKSHSADSDGLPLTKTTEEVDDDLEDEFIREYNLLKLSSEQNSVQIFSKDTGDEELPPIKHGEPVTDRRSTFQAHLAPVVTLKQVKMVLNKLHQNKKIGNATHNIYAYRIYCEDKQTFIQDCEDDGETAAGGRLLHLLQILDVRNVMVVVSRWYGGILLGPDRFKHINNCARNILVDENYTESGVRNVWNRFSPVFFFTVSAIV